MQKSELHIENIIQTANVTTSQNWLIDSFEYLSHLHRWQTIYSSLSEEERSLLRYSHHEKLKKNNSSIDEIFTMNYTELFLNKDPSNKNPDNNEFNINFEQSIALSLILSQEKKPKESLDFLKKAIDMKKLDMEDCDGLVKVFSIIIGNLSDTIIARDASSTVKLVNAKKLVHYIEKLKRDFNKNQDNLRSNSLQTQKTSNSYFCTLKSKINSIFTMLEEDKTEHGEKQNNSISLSLKHRQEYLVEKTELSQLIDSDIDAYVKVTQELYYTSSLDLQEIPRTIINKNLSRFGERKIRVPYIAISKYNNATILQHQFIRSEDGYVSMDSQEELVDKDDKVWFHERSTVKFDGNTYCIPRLPTQQFSINPRTVSLAKNKRKIEITKICLFVPAWYSTNISHWLIDVLPRIYFAKTQLKLPVVYILPKGPNQTCKETLDLLEIDQKDIVWHDNNIDIATREMYTISRMASMYNYFSAEFYEFYDHLKDKILGSSTKEKNPTKKIYISRRDSERRKCINEQELENELKKLGFKIVVLQGMPFEKRIKLFANAKLVIGASGAGLIHMLYMQRRTSMIILGSEQMHTNSSVFSKIAMYKSMYLTIISSVDQDDLHSPWTANINQVIECIGKTSSLEKL